MNFFIAKNKDKVLDEFVTYHKKTKENNLFIIRGTISGIKSLKSSKVIPKDLLPDKDEKNYIFEALGNSKFSKEKKEIPKDYKKVKRNDDWVIRVFLEKYISPEKILKLNTQGYELSKWIDKTRKYWLTIKDIEKIKINKKIKLVVLDRNIYDNKDVFKKGTLYKPENFFINDSAVYWKTSIAGLDGKIKHKWQNNTDEPYNIGFDIEYKKNNWYPLINGILPAEDEQGFSQLLGVEKSWSEFPKTTHIGWRGPIIIWDDLKHLDKVYLL